MVHLGERAFAIQSTNMIKSKYSRTLEMQQIRILRLMMNVDYFMTSQEKKENNGFIFDFEQKVMDNNNMPENALLGFILFYTTF